MDRLAIANGYADLMARYAMPLFNTQTWDQKRHHPPHPETVVKANRYFIGHVNDALHGRNWRRKGIIGCQFVVGVEPQKSGVLHSHSVIGHPDLELGADEYAPLRRDMQAWSEEQWGYARLTVAKSADAVNLYVAKYIVKHGEITISEKLEALANGQLSLASTRQ